MSFFGGNKPEDSKKDDRNGHDDRSFEEVYNRYFPELYLYLHLITQDPEEIRDIIQDVFIKFLLRDHDSQRIDNVRSWLYCCARNAALNGIRDRNNRLRLLREFFDEQPFQAEEMSPEEVQLLIRFTNEAIDKLPPACKEIFNMAKRLKMSYAQIAEAKGISVKTVGAQMGIALKKIREYVKGKF